MRGMEENPYRAPVEQGAKSVRQKWRLTATGWFLLAAAVFNLLFGGASWIYMMRKQPSLTWKDAALPMALMAISFLCLLFVVWQNRRPADQQRTR